MFWEAGRTSVPQRNFFGALPFPGMEFPHGKPNNNCVRLLAEAKERLLRKLDRHSSQKKYKSVCVCIVVLPSQLLQALRWPSGMMGIGPEHTCSLGTNSDHLWCNWMRQTCEVLFHVCLRGASIWEFTWRTISSCYF